MHHRTVLALTAVSAAFTWSAITQAQTDDVFTIVVIPDTQNMIDFRRQRAQGFAIDARDLFIEQMEDIASKTIANGGNVVFATSVGDVWQNVTSERDPGHVARGLVPLRGVDEEFEATIDRLVQPDPVLNFEIPTAVEGYRIISDTGIPFGVAPGNHDYDAWWVVGVEQASGPPDLQYHIGGLGSFRAAFGEDSEFFRGRDWYVGAYAGGTSSAQVFSGAGYEFLHLSLEMQAGDDVLAWAREIIAAHPGLPTIISTHDYLNARGERRPGPNMDLAATDPDGNNSAEEIWQTFISDIDQIFMVLCGHQLGQALRIDRNDYGHDVYQILSDYQRRGQIAVDAGQTTTPATGDGWYREMTFHLDGATPRVAVRTYSSYFDRYSSEMPAYADWYKSWEQPDKSAAEFLAADEFAIELTDFRARFTPADH